MASVTVTHHTNDTGLAGSAMPKGVAITGRRATLRIIAGLLAIALGFVVGAVVLSGLNKTVEVLAVARPVAAGAALTDADLRTVSIVPDPSLHVIAASRRPELVGQRAAVPLTAGSLLTGEQIGAVTDPGAGQSILALAVKTGRAPAGLSAGTPILVLVVRGGGATEMTPVQAPAIVRDVQQPDTAGLTVVTVQLPSDAAIRVASAAGEVTIVVQGR